MRRIRRLAALTAWTSALGVVAWWVWRLELGPAPELALRPAAWLDWLAGTDPALVVAHTIRIGVLATATWLAATAALALVASIAGHDGLLGVALALSPRVLRRLLRSSAATALSIGLATGGSMAATTTVGSGAAAATSKGQATATMVLRTDPAAVPMTAGVATLRVAAARPGTESTREPPQATLRVAAAGPGIHTESNPETPWATLRLRPLAVLQPSSAAPGIETATEPAEARPAAETRSPTAAATAHVVQSGECFWSIAAEVVGEELGRRAADAEIAPYFRRLVAANESRLVVPGEPDLLFAGQQLILPPPPH